MNQKNVLVGCGVVLLLLAVSTARTEYARIQARIETTQAKVDALADELTETTGTIHAAIKSITDRFTKALDEKSMQIESKPVIVEHPKANEPIKTFEPPKQPLIVMHTADEEKGVVCGPCRSWLKTEKAKWEQSGWTVTLAKEIETKRGWPWFEITERDGGKFEVDGPLTNDNFLAAKKAR